MEKIKPKVTIVTITYNLINAGRKDTIRQCIESVHNQTYENIEHLIIDGASNDGTLDILKEYEEKGWVKCYSEKDSGIYNAFNKGILKASGDYIIFLNSDDFYNSKFGIEKSVNALLKSKADYSYAAIFLLDESKNNELKKYKPRTSKFFRLMPFGHQSMLCKKSIFINEGLFDENYRIAGDYDFVIRLKLKGYKGICVNHIFATFRMGGEADSNTSLTDNECEKIFETLYKPLLSDSELAKNKNFLDQEFPSILFFKLFKYHSLKDKCILIFRALRKSLLDFRISKRYAKLRILGFWLIKPVQD